MKLKMLAAVAAVLAVACVASAQAPPASGSPFGYQIAYDFNSHKTLALGSYSATAINDAFGFKGLNLQGLAFGGSSIGGGGVTGGIGVGLSKSFGKLNGIVGVGQAFFAGQAPHAFVFGGISGSW